VAAIVTRPAAVPGIDGLVANRAARYRLLPGGALREIYLRFSREARALISTQR
jgi:hypothetical protein